MRFGGQASQSGVSTAGIRSDGAGIVLKFNLGREKFWTVNFGTVSLGIVSFGIGVAGAGAGVFFSTTWACLWLSFGGLG